jgi:nicotinate-nucleotide adenylyltransferase
MRIALFGGSFDPPHLGHTGIALAAAARLNLDRILMAPAGRQPLKRDQPQSSFADRLAMVRLACAGHAPLEPSDIDAPRADGRFNYTYDTLQQLRASFPNDEIFCLIGADSLQTLQHWHRAAEALMLAQWIVAARPGFPQSGALVDALNRLLPTGIEATPPEETGECIRIPLTSGSSQQTLWFLPNLDYEISATALRTALAVEPNGITQHVLEPAVADYARIHNLYSEPNNSSS